MKITFVVFLLVLGLVLGIEKGQEEKEGLDAKDLLDQIADLSIQDVYDDFQEILNMSEEEMKELVRSHKDMYEERGIDIEKYIDAKPGQMPTIDQMIEDFASMMSFMDTGEKVDTEILNQGEERAEMKLKLEEEPDMNQIYYARIEAISSEYKYLIPEFFDFVYIHSKYYSRVKVTWANELPHLVITNQDKKEIVNEMIVGWNSTEIINALSTFSITKDIAELDSIENIIEEITGVRP
ncbi:unnamed protein product [Moneuplotes crassus]|uniref:Uncharacterized protein n=1 Tax=Euplotes crassus TaxID=5936 RepID=A0AAD1XS99_EUPCR|nr:unnamed protein product [Moneuplotes crassus]